MTVLTVVGENDAGKTSSLRKVIEMICLCGGEIQDVEGASRLYSFIIPNRIDKLYKYKDITVMIFYKGKTFGITTLGDYVEGLEKRFKLLENCDFFICASHPNDDTAKFIKALSNKYPVKRIPKTSTSSDKSQQENDNAEFAKQLVDIIEEYLKK